jgi:hypothetical protein
MSRQAKPGQRVSASSPNRIAASLITSSLRSTAATVLGSSRNVSKSVRRELLDQADSFSNILK